MADNKTVGRVYTMMCPRPEEPPPQHGPGQYMSPTDPAEDARRRREANNLGILLLGPVFGGFAALARLANAPEATVEQAAELPSSTVNRVSH